MSPTIALKIGSKFLELGSAKITLTIFNQLLQVGIIRDNYTYSFQLPYTAANESILGSVGRIDSTNMHQDNFSVQIFAFGVLWSTGVLIVEEASAGEFYKVKIDFDFGAFSRAVGDKKLAEIFAGGANQIISTSNTGYNFYKRTVFFAPDPGFFPDTITYSLVIDSVEYASIFLPAQTDTLEHIAENLAAAFNANAAVNTVWIAYAFTPAGTSTPAITLLPVTPTSAVVAYRITQTQTLPATGFSQVDYSFTNINETKPDISPEYTHICFPRIRASTFYGNENNDFLGILNDYAGAYRYNTLSQFVSPTAPPANYNDYSHCPCLKLFSLIDFIVSAAGWSWEGDFKNNTVFQKLLLYSNYAADEIDEANIPASFNFNRHQRQIYYANLVPDMTVKEFFEQLQELFCLYYTFDATNKILRIDFKKDVFAAAVIESYNAKFALKKEVNEVKENVSIYYDTDLKIYDYYTNPAPQGSYRTTKEYKIRAGAMPYELPSYPAIWLEKGNSPMFSLGTTNNKNKLYLFFWRGLQTVSGTTLPTAEGKATFGTGSLDWNEYLYAFWEKYVAYLLTNKAGEGVAILQLDELRKAFRSLARKYQYANYPFLIEKIEAEMEMGQDIAGAKVYIRKLGL